jgi:hypothetical protein
MKGFDARGGIYFEIFQIFNCEDLNVNKFFFDIFATQTQKIPPLGI